MKKSKPLIKFLFVFPEVEEIDRDENQANGNWAYLTFCKIETDNH